MNNHSKTTIDRTGSNKTFVNSFRIDFTPNSKNSASGMKNPGFSATMTPIIKKKSAVSKGGRKHLRHVTRRHAKRKLHKKTRRHSTYSRTVKK